MINFFYFLNRALLAHKAVTKKTEMNFYSDLIKKSLLIEEYSEKLKRMERLPAKGELNSMIIYCYPDFSDMIKKLRK